jgi:hypothetical protein
VNCHLFGDASMKKAIEPAPLMTFHGHQRQVVFPHKAVQFFRNIISFDGLWVIWVIEMG